jgi:hypothetical protein
MKLSTGLYKAARTARSIESLSGPSKAGRRTKNVAVGRAAARSGFWNRLFGGGGKR